MASKVEIAVTAKDEASPALQQVAKSMDKISDAQKEASSASTKSSSAFSGFLSNITMAINPMELAAKALQLLRDVASAAAKEFADAEIVSAQLDAVLKSTGGAAGVTRDEIDALASSLQEVSGVGDDVIRRGAALMLTFTQIGEESFPKAIEAALNLSMAMGTDLQSSIIQVGKALNEPIQGVSALRRVGVQLTDEQEKSVKAFMDVNDIASAQAIILGELEKQFGGVAEAMGNTTIGSANKLKAAWGDLLEAMGEDSAGVWRQTNEGLTEIILTMTEVTTETNKYKSILRELNPQLANQLQATGRITPEMRVLVEQYEFANNELERAAEYGRAWERVLIDQSDATSEVARATNDMAISMEAVKAGIQGTIRDATDKYNDSLDSLKVKHADLSRELEALQRQGWQPTSDKILDVTQKLKDNEQAQLDAAEAMQTAIDKMIFQQASAGLDAAAQLELARAMGILDEESYNVALATQALKKQYDDGKISASEYARKVAELRDTINELKDKNITITANLLRTGNWDFVAPDTIGGGNRYSKGTEGWEQVPPGYPNDTYPIMLTSGERFAVIPQGQNAQPVGGGVGGNSYSVVLQVNSPVTIMDEEKTQNVLIPMLEGAMREMEIRGTIKGVMN